MRNCLLLFGIFISLHSAAQKVYFPERYYADSTVLSQHISLLANDIIHSYRNADKLSYYDNLFRYQIVAEQYEESNRTLDSLRDLIKSKDPVGSKGIALQFQTFATAKLMQSKKQLTFDDAYLNVLSRLYNDLPEKAQGIATSYFSTDLNKLRSNLSLLLDKQKGKDSIDLSDARALVRAYNSYNVYSHITSLSKAFFIDFDLKKFIVQDSVLITMRDGVKVAAIVVRSKNLVLPQSVVMISSIYYSPQDVAKAKDIVRRGYAGVILSTRGKYLSDAPIEPFEHDANDAYDVIDWISKQNWCNGKVGMYGGSYSGFIQWAAVKKMHPALKTIVPQVAACPGIDLPMHSGVFLSYMLRWLHYVTSNNANSREEFNNIDEWNKIFKNWYKSGKPFRNLDRMASKPNTVFQRWLQHPSYDDYWQNMTPQKEEYKQINIPVLTITGYFDDEQRGAFHYYNEHLRYNESANHYLLIGPWDHYGAQNYGYSTAGYTIDSVTSISIDDIVFQWFDYVLKDSSKPAILKNKFNYEVMGTNQWKHAASIRETNNDTLTFYLSNTRSTNDFYQLRNTKPATKNYIKQQVDFKDKSDSSDMNDIRNSDDYLILDSMLNRRNYLSFISKPLAKPVEITGSFAGEVVAEINKNDVDINVQLYELQPDGKYFLLSSYLTRASYTKDKSNRQLLQPGKEESIPINNSYFVSKKLDKGSQIIVLLGVNKNRDWQVNYGTGKDVSDEMIDDAKVPLQIKWFTTSLIKIPIQK